MRYETRKRAEVKQADNMQDLCATIRLRRIKKYPQSRNIKLAELKPAFTLGR